jgi:NADH:ubiquinone reductase (H+-translocating)
LISGISRGPNLGKADLTSPTSRSGPARVLIVGAGFGGMAAAMCLREESRAGRAEVTLVSRRNYHLFTPLLYQTATGLVDIDHLAQAVRPQARKRGFRFLEGEVLGVDLEAKSAKTNFGELRYDYLVLAVGSVTNDFGIRGVSKNTLPLKTLGDGERMHNKIVESLERASVEESEDAKKALLTFVVIGGGPTGVELAGSLRDFMRLMRKDYPVLAEHEPVVVIVEAMQTLLPGLSEYSIANTSRILLERGVELRLSSKVVEVSDKGVLLGNGELIASANVFWTAGVKPTKLVEDLQVEKERGRIKVDGHLRVVGHPEVFAIGDIANVPDSSTGKRLPETAQVALREGRWLGRSLPAIIAGKSIPEFHYASKGFMFSLGRNVGVADLGWLKTSGYLGWLIWRVVHISQISAARNRLGVVFDWTFAYFNRRNAAHTDL